MATHVGSKKKYIGLGRRKAAVSRAWVYPSGQGLITINDQLIDDFVQHDSLKTLIMQPLTVTEQVNNFDISIKAAGGGFHAQAQASRLAISRALLKVDLDFRKVLKSAGLLSTDARVRERKKPGLKKARKAPQYTKR